MPELPEVETIARQLQKSVLGKTITKINIHDSKVAHRALAKISSQKINNIERYGKYLLMRLDQNNLLVHLRMTGYFQYVPKNKPVNQKYLAAQLLFNDGSQLTFHEIRRFGFIRQISHEQLQALLENIGPDPVHPSFTFPVFSSVISPKQNANIKAALMDQSVIAGIGNIYAQEALYHAKINPQRKISTLSIREMKRLHHHLSSTLQSAIKHCGTTVQNYVNINGEGKFQHFLAVYEKERCPKQHPLQRIVVGGRGTYWCKRCQR